MALSYRKGARKGPRAKKGTRARTRARKGPRARKGTRAKERRRANTKIIPYTAKLITAAERGDRGVPIYNQYGTNTLLATKLPTMPKTELKKK
jgi:hypothetical protein